MKAQNESRSSSFGDRLPLAELYKKGGEERMFTEKRGRTRVDVHLATEINVVDETQKWCEFFGKISGERKNIPVGDHPKACGYIINLSEEGIGVVALEPLPLGAKVSLMFFVEGMELIPGATLVHNKCVGDLHYYGFKIVEMTEIERRILRRYIRASQFIYYHENRQYYRDNTLPQEVNLH